VSPRMCIFVKAATADYISSLINSNVQSSAQPLPNHLDMVLLGIITQHHGRC